MKQELVMDGRYKEIRFGDEVFYIDPKYEKTTPKATKLEDERERESLAKNGQKYPIKINPQRIVLAGHRRIGFLHEINPKLTPKYEVERFDHPLQELLFVIRDNTEKRNFTAADLIMLEKKAVEIEEKLERELIKEGKMDKTDKKKGKKSEKIAERIPYSPRTVEKMLFIEKNGTKDQIELLTNSESQTKINTIYKDIKITKDIDQLQNSKLPEEGVYGNKFVFDWGWRYKNTKTGGSLSSAANQKFITKTVDKIIEEDVPIVKKMMAKDSVAYFWTTVPMYNDQLRVIDALGLKYKTKLFWIKEELKNLKVDPNKGGWGYWYQGVVEECIVAIKGNVKAFRSPSNNIIFGKSGIHSEKPDSFMDLVKDSTKNMIKGDIIDLFGRKEVEGVKAIGNQIIKNGKVVPIQGAAA